MITAPEQLPLVLKTEHVMQLTGFSRPTVYNLLQEAMRTKMFPVKKPGAEYLIGRDGFLAWLNDQKTAQQPKTD